jgi:hypothetical protein
MQQTKKGKGDFAWQRAIATRSDWFVFACENSFKITGIKK